MGLGGAPADPAGGDAEGGDSRSGSGERRAASDLLGQGRTPCSVVVSCRQTGAGCAWSAAGRGAGRFVPTAGDQIGRASCRERVRGWAEGGGWKSGDRRREVMMGR